MALVLFFLVLLFPPREKPRINAAVAELTSLPFRVTFAAFLAAGAAVGVAFCVAAFLTGAFLAGAFLAAVFLVAVFLLTASLSAAFFGAAFLAGFFFAVTTLNFHVLLCG